MFGFYSFSREMADGYLIYRRADGTTVKVTAVADTPDYRNPDVPDMVCVGEVAEFVSNDMWAPAQRLMQADRSGSMLEWPDECLSGSSFMSREWAEELGLDVEVKSVSGQKFTFYDIDPQFDFLKSDVRVDPIPYESALARIVTRDLHPEAPFILIDDDPAKVEAFKRLFHGTDPAKAREILMIRIKDSE